MHTPTATWERCESNPQPWHVPHTLCIQHTVCVVDLSCAHALRSLCPVVRMTCQTVRQAKAGIRETRGDETTTIQLLQTTTY